METHTPTTATRADEARRLARRFEKYTGPDGQLIAQVESMISTARPDQLESMISAMAEILAAEDAQHTRPRPDPRRAGRPATEKQVNALVRRATRCGCDGSDLAGGLLRETIARDLTLAEASGIIGSGRCPMCGS